MPGAQRFLFLQEVFCLARTLMPPSSERHFWVTWHITVNYGSSRVEFTNDRALLFVCPRHKVKCFIQIISFIPSLYKVGIKFSIPFSLKWKQSSKGHLLRITNPGNDELMSVTQNDHTSKEPPMSPMVTIPAICSYSVELCVVPMRAHCRDDAVSWLDRGREAAGWSPPGFFDNDFNSKKRKWVWLDLFPLPHFQYFPCPSNSSEYFYLFFVTAYDVQCCLKKNKKWWEGWMWYIPATTLPILLFIPKSRHQLVVFSPNLVVRWSH